MYDGPGTTEPESWHLTIILLEGLRLMRPEKAWRPIVTVEVDKHHTHETTLGVDGQNINQKEIFKFHDASSSSRVEINVWHRSQSKKKKRKILVASAVHSLGELLKKQETEPNLEIRLQCRTADQKCVASKGRPQKGALLRLRLKAPPTIHDPPLSPVESNASGWPDDGNGSAAESEYSSSAATDLITFDEPSQPPQTIRRRIRGYIVNTDDEGCSSSECEDIPETRSLRDDNSYSGTCIDDDDKEIVPYSKHNEQLVFRSYDGEIISFSPGEGEWIAASPDMLLPRYTEKITVPPKLTKVERVLSSFTMYGELASAETDDQFEPVFRRLQQEWTFIGGLLVALAAVDTAVFSISPGSIFNVDSYARGAIATSSIASGLGIACDAWFLLRYNWADLRTFISRSRDLFESYFFFSLSARVPALCMFISAVSMMGFLGMVAFDAWPQGVIVMCFLVGIIMSLQFLVFGAHWCAKRVAQGGRVGGMQVVKAVRVVRSMTG